MAIIDDFTFVGRSSQVCASFDRLFALSPAFGLSLKLSKCRVLWPHSSSPPSSLVEFCSSRGLPLVFDGIPTLGAVLTLDRAFARSWVLSHVSSRLTRSFNLLMHKSLPLHYAYHLLRFSTIHSLTFLSRVVPPDVLAPTAAWFDLRVSAVCMRLLDLARPPSPSVRRQLALPIRLGGFGLRSICVLSPLAFYASLASSLPFIARSFSGCCSTSSVANPASAASDVHVSHASRSDLDGRLVDSAPVAIPPSFPLLTSLFPFLSSFPFLSRLSLPSSADSYWSTFSRVSPPPRLQRLLTFELDSTLFRDHSSFVGKSPVASRAFASASHPTSRYWLSSLPTLPSLSLSSSEFTLASRLRLFLPPSDSLPLLCLCSAPLTDPTHFLSCERLKDLRRVRHDRIVRLLSSLIQRIGGVCQVEPSHFLSIRPDILGFLFNFSFILDLVITHPCSPSYLSRSDAPLTAASHAESRKISKYAPLLATCNSEFIPFSIETFGALAPKALAFVSRLSASSSYPSHSIPPPPILASLSILLQSCNAYILSRGVVLSSPMT